MIHSVGLFLIFALNIFHFSIAFIPNIRSKAFLHSGSFQFAELDQLETKLNYLPTSKINKNRPFRSKTYLRDILGLGMPSSKVSCNRTIALNNIFQDRRRSRSL